MQVHAAVQLPQSAYAPLLPPLALAGLGETNDYVEALVVGLPSGQVRRFAEAVLPNSRLVVIPVPFNVTGAWELRLLLERPQQARIAAVIAALLGVLAVAVLQMQLVERGQDARELRAMKPAMPL